MNIYSTEVQERAARVRMAVFDVDGVMTDGRLFIGDDGVEYKAFHSHDGHGLRMLQSSGVKTAIITGRQSVVVARRAQELRIDHLYQGRREKLSVLQELLDDCGYQAEQLAYVGDDLVDLPIMRRVGLAVAVANAHPVVREHCHWITTASGGQGAVREICELIMQAQGSWSALVETYLT